MLLGIVGMLKADDVGIFVFELCLLGINLINKSVMGCVFAFGLIMFFCGVIGYIIIGRSGKARCNACFSWVYNIIIVIL